MSDLIRVVFPVADLRASVYSHALRRNSLTLGLRSEDGNPNVWKVLC